MGYTNCGKNSTIVKTAKRGVRVLLKRERGRVYIYQFLLLAAGCPDRSKLPQHSFRQKRLENEEC
jgi:hypothetical protein